MPRPQKSAAVFCAAVELAAHGRSGAPYIAIEPWNGLPDPADADGDLAHKPAILRLDPGESAKGVHSITFFPYARG